MSAEERRRRKREAEKLHRKRIQSDPILGAQELAKRLECIARLKKIRQSKKISKKEVQRQREKWRLAKQRYVQKQKGMLDKMEATQSTRAESIRRKAKRRAENKGIRYLRVVKKLEEKSKKSDRLATKYKLRYYRLQKKLRSDSDSPMSKVNRELKVNKEKVFPRVRKKLVFHEAVMDDIGKSLSKITSKRDQNLISEKIHLSYVKKY